MPLFIVSNGKINKKISVKAYFKEITCTLSPQMLTVCHIPAGFPYGFQPFPSGLRKVIF